jgi:hypothetical protein
MPFMRRRPLLRTAVIGGGAYAMGKHSERKQSEQQEQAYEAGQQTAAPPPAAAGPSGTTSDDIERLKQLGKLHEQGILTDEEFSEQKARILGTA